MTCPRSLKSARQEAVDVPHGGMSAVSSPLSGLERLLHPLPPSVFFEQYWEQRPLLLKRNDATFYSNLFSRRDVDSWLDNAGKAANKESQTHAGKKTAAAASFQDVNDSVSPLCFSNNTTPQAICVSNSVCSCAYAAWSMARKWSGKEW
jgi:hypothetical protein